MDHAIGDAVYRTTCRDCEGAGVCGAQHRSGVACTRGAACDGQHSACTSRHGAVRWQGGERAERRPAAVPASPEKSSQSEPAALAPRPRAAGPGPAPADAKAAELVGRYGPRVALRYALARRRHAKDPALAEWWGDVAEVLGEAAS